MKTLDSFKSKLQAWNNCTFGNIFRRKKRVLARQEGKQKALASHPSDGLLMMEDGLKKEWDEILMQKELIWKQKSRIDWLRAGDKNTKLFHISTIIRRRRNRVES